MGAVEATPFLVLTHLRQNSSLAQWSQRSHFHRVFLEEKYQKQSRRQTQIKHTTKEATETVLTDDCLRGPSGASQLKVQRTSRAVWKENKVNGGSRSNTVSSAHSPLTGLVTWVSAFWEAVKSAESLPPRFSGRKMSKHGFVTRASLKPANWSGSGSDSDSIVDRLRLAARRSRSVSADSPAFVMPVAERFPPAN